MLFTNYKMELDKENLSSVNAVAANGGTMPLMKVISETLRFETTYIESL